MAVDTSADLPWLVGRSPQFSAVVWLRAEQGQDREQQEHGQRMKLIRITYPVSLKMNLEHAF